MNAEQWRLLYSLNPMVGVIDGFRWCTDIVIQAENLGKKYTIGHQTSNGRYTALRDVWMQNARSLWHKTRDLVQGKPIIMGDELEEFWALKEVNFEIQRGETICARRSSKRSSRY